MLFDNMVSEKEIKMANKKEIQVLGVNNEVYPIELMAIAMSSDPLPTHMEDEKMEVEFCTLNGVLFYNIRLQVLDEKKRLRIMKMLPEKT
jgi:hypothetical protein